MSHGETTTHSFRPVAMSSPVSVVSVLLLLSIFVGWCSCGVVFPEDVVQHYGYINVNQTYGVNLFYW